MKSINNYFDSYMKDVKSKVDELYKSELEAFDYIGKGKFKNRYSVDNDFYDEEEVFTIADFHQIFDEWTHNNIEESLRDFISSYLKWKLASSNRL